MSFEEIKPFIVPMLLMWGFIIVAPIMHKLKPKKKDIDKPEDFDE